MNRTALCIAMIFLLFTLSACRQEPGKAEEKKDAPGPAMTIVAVGDSLTAGLGVAEEDSYPALLQRRLQEEGHDVQVINAGVSGETTSGTLARIDWVMTMKPDFVILETGANDGLRGIDVGLIRKNLREIITRLKEKEVVVLLAGMRMVWNLGPAYAADFNRIYPEIAEAEKVVFMPFFLEGVATNPTLNQEDGLHPNPRGYKIVVDKLLPFVKEAMAEVGGNARSK